MRGRTPGMNLNPQNGTPSLQASMRLFGVASSSRMTESWSLIIACSAQSVSGPPSTSGFRLYFDYDHRSLLQQGRRRQNLPSRCAHPPTEADQSANRRVDPGSRGQDSGQDCPTPSRVTLQVQTQRQIRVAWRTATPVQSRRELEQTMINMSRVQSRCFMHQGDLDKFLRHDFNFPIRGNLNSQFYFFISIRG